MMMSSNFNLGAGGIGYPPLLGGRFPTAPTPLPTMDFARFNSSSPHTEGPENVRVRNS